MTYSSELEKKNLGLHVELAAQRFESFDKQILVIENKIAKLQTGIDDLRKFFDNTNEKNDINVQEQIEALEQNIKDVRMLVDVVRKEHNDHLIKWGGAIISTLLAALGILLIRVIFPILLGKAAGNAAP